jgi:pyruvate dehydrogenase E2 component (dihydrolipoamide acetyltransferase)
VPIDIVMPALEMAQETALLVRWVKNEGDHVSKGDVLMEIETDKATLEIESPGVGILSRVSARAGDQVPVGQVIAVLLDAVKSMDAGGAPTPHVGTQIGGDLTDERYLNDARVISDKAEAKLPMNKRISPKARRLALEHGLDLACIQGSGAEQTIRANDVSRLLSPLVGVVVSDNYTAVPLKGKRKVTAERTQRSYQTAPHISLSLSIDMSEAQRLILKGQTTRKDDSDTAPKLTSILLRAAVEALSKVPELNAHLVNDEVRQYRQVHLGIAVAVEDGLVVPVIRDAGHKSLMAIDCALKSLVSRARNRCLRPDEITGSTFTVSNLGMFGIERFSAILNPPEVGILSLGCIIDRPTKLGETVQFRPFIEATASVDHRAIDGVGAAKYLQELKHALEYPHVL